MRSWYLNLPLVLISGIILAACSSKATKQDVHLASNRKISVSLRHYNGPQDPAIQEFIKKIAKKALEGTYGSNTTVIPLQDQLVESPENLYAFGKNEIDDIFIVDATVDPSFQVPGPQTMEGTAMTAPLDLSVNILNGANLRTVMTFQVAMTPVEARQFETAFLDHFKKRVLEVFSNPNVYPRNNPEHFGNLLFVFSKKLEEDNADGLTCETAPGIFQYYVKAKELFEMAKARGLQKAVGTQEGAQELQVRIDEASEKASIAERCDEERKSTFRIDFDFGKISPDYQVYIMRAFEAAGLEKLLQQYTKKPVKFHFQLDGQGGLSLNVNLRFDRNLYQAWTKNRIPEKYKNFQILSLDPYYALMQKLIVFRGSLPGDAPAPLRAGFLPMKMSITLDTLLNGSVNFGVDGEWNAQTKVLRMAYPNSLFMTTPGFESKTITNKDPQLFQEKGWIALGSCRTIEGALTEDGIVYRFFGFPCE